MKASYFQLIHRTRPVALPLPPEHDCGGASQGKQHRSRPEPDPLTEAVVVAEDGAEGVIASSIGKVVPETRWVSRDRSHRKSLQLPVLGKGVGVH